MRKRVFIDGQDGTTGLGIHARLARRADIELLSIPPERKKDPSAKRDVLRSADLAILCLPDAAAVETVELARGLDVKIIDASTAHRTQRDWVYGMPELSAETRRTIADARRVANPGCYPTGFLLAIRPLIDSEVLSPDYPVTITAVSGFSGGGKSLIAAFAEHERQGPTSDWTARPYALTLAHKHVPEMRLFAGLTHPPLFCPMLGNYYAGMIVSVPLHRRLLRKNVGPGDIHAVLADRYASERFVRVMPLGGADALEGGCLSPTRCNGTNDIEIFVFGHDDQVLVSARLDNLGKGASGAAVQNLNLMLGFDEATGL